ncbi:MAG: hypothetical protein LBQ66_06705, partial [Planctomycetaceae bacterium]|nr:hypothetical protein [Planctomycetaceae bacterium]
AALRLHGVIKIQHLRCCSAPKQTREYVYDLCGITRAGCPRSSPCRFAAVVGVADNWGVLVLSMRVPPPFGFCPFRARVIWGDFSQGVALCYGLVAPLGRKKIRRNVRQSIPFVA